MDTLLSYLLRSALVSGLMLGYYHLALRNRRSHSFNRLWLLTALLAGTVLPLIHIGWLTWHSAAPPSTIMFAAGRPHPAAQSLPITAIVPIFAATISVSFLLILGWRVFRVYRLKRGHQRYRIEGCVLIEVQDRRAPFSFLKNLFWQEGADLNDPVHRKILDHELAHIRGGHTYDTLFAQILAAIFWMNPFYWLIRQELQMVHEFIADDASIATGDTETFALMLLRAYDDGRYLDPAHSFFHSPIKRRLRMISSSKPPSGLWKALALPILLAGVVLACSKEQNAPVQTTKPLQLSFSKPLKLTMDSVDALKLKMDAFQKTFRIDDKTKAGALAKIMRDSVLVKGYKADEAIRVNGFVIRDDSQTPPPPPPQK